MQPMLNEAITKQLNEVFQNLEQPVEVALFNDPTNPETSEALQQLLAEVCALSEKLHLRSYQLPQDAAIAAQYHMDKTPGFTLLGQTESDPQDYGVRFAGFPGQYEFTSLINDLVMVSQRKSGVRPETSAALAGLKDHLHLMVFVTPTCPYCPRAVMLAHQFAMESPLIEAEMIEATDFRALAEQYNVSSVPHTIINQGQGEWIGALPEAAALQEILHTLQEEK
jgi:glutaredoxin-like protein